MRNYYATMGNLNYAHADKRLVGAQAATELVPAPGEGQRLVIMKLVVGMTLATSLTVFAGSDAEGHRLIDLPDGCEQGIREEYPDGLPLAENTGLAVTTGAGDAYVVVEYYTAPV
jgi:hypothetical protein